MTENDKEHDGSLGYFYKKNNTLSIHFGGKVALVCVRVATALLDNATSVRRVEGCVWSMEVANGK